MFLFKPWHVAMIQSNEKTQTRRIHKRFRAKVGAVHQVRTELFGEAKCHIQILRRWEERLEDISEQDARAEGGYDREEYIQGLIDMHNGEISRDSVLKCYAFRLIDHYCPKCGAPMIPAQGIVALFYLHKCTKCSWDDGYGARALVEKPGGEA